MSVPVERGAFEVVVELVETLVVVLVVTLVVALVVEPLVGSPLSPASEWIGKWCSCVKSQSKERTCGLAVNTAKQPGAPWQQASEAPGNTVAFWHPWITAGDVKASVTSIGFERLRILRPRHTVHSKGTSRSLPTRAGCLNRSKIAR
eukprot:3423879-Pleurochrysis_carterae.AAC.2